MYPIFYLLEGEYKALGTQPLPSKHPQQVGIFLSRQETVFRYGLGFRILGFRGWGLGFGV